jgi:predicted transcriptional regulator
MLSDVLTHASKDDVWVTVQRHLNIIAIAGMREIAAIIIVNGRQPDEETLSQANTEKLPVLGTDMKAFEVVGKLYQLGIRNENEDV